jgi:ABC-type bacteriocin/lantibiotic exporter with double-glycine peptidase domain
MIRQLLFILSNKIKVELLFLFFLNFVAAFLEIISIGSIPIFLMYIINPGDLVDKIPHENFQKFFQNFLETTDSLTSLKLILLFIFLVFLVKNLIILFNSIYQAFFNRRITSTLMSGLFNNYLTENYSFYLNNKPSELIKNIESAGTVRSLITMLLTGAKEMLTVLGLLIIIGISDYRITIMMSIIGLIIIIFHKFKISNLLIKHGKKSYEYTESRFSLINEFFGSIIDIKITDKEKYFSKLFRQYIWSYESAKIVDKIAVSLVRPIIEMIGISIMVMAIIIFSGQGKTFLEIIPIVALLSLSFIRILPSVVMLLNITNRIKFESSQLKYLLKKVSLKNPDYFVDADKKNIKFNNKIEIKDLSYKYLGSNSNNISNINMTINKGDTIGVIGGSGSGKTTLINNICNLLKFDEGKIFIDDEKIFPKENFYISNLGYIRQQIYLLNDTIQKNIIFGENLKNCNNEKIKDSLIQAGLGKYKNNLDLEIGNRGSKISGGENQLLGLARAIYREPKLLFLDEPTSNLDYRTQKNYLETIKDLNITSVIIAHRIEVLDICNKIILMENGKIIDQGDLGYFKSKYSNLENYLD